MRKSAILTALLIFAAFALGSLPSQNGYDLFQKALAKERGEGNLEEAIALYQKVIDETKDESLAAKAQLRIGFCYEKLGREEARKAFQKVVDNYPAQVDTVKTAREKLVLLQRGQMDLEKGLSQTRLRLVWGGPDVELMGAASPDGRYICYTDWDTGDLAIHDLKTGEKRRLTGQTKWDGSFVENSRWSPDGKLIAFTWDMGVTAELRIVGLDGGKPRVLYQGKGYPEVMDWSPDGRQILAVLYSQIDEQSISLIDALDGSVRHLKNLTFPVTYSSGRAGHMEFSPDGKFIAYEFHNDIHILSADGKTENPLVKHPANDRLLGWTPDGKYILFRSDRTGANDAWLLPLTDGKAGGEPELIQKDVGEISSLGFTRDGAFFYGHGKDMQKIYVATIERKAEALSATYQKMELPYEGRNHTAEYSPDGKRLAFVRQAVPRIDGSKYLCIFSPETGEEKTFALEITRVNTLHWAPDGSSIMISGFDEKRTYVARMDTRTGDLQEIFPTDKDVREEMYLSPAWSPDGQTVYCVHIAQVMKAERQLSIVAKDLSTGQTRNVHKMDNLPTISISPDGEWLAALEQAGNEVIVKVLKVIPTKNGDVRELCRFASASKSVLEPRWSADGRYIFFPGRHEGEETWDIWYVPIEGGDPGKLGLAVHRLWSIGPHPDGSRIAFTSFGPTLHGPEVWVMENFLPSANPGEGHK
jgi:Tol biopolymer transport system component